MQRRHSTRDRAVDAVLWTLTVVFAATTIWLSFGPTPPGVQAFPGADKVWHGVAYFVTTSSLLLVAIWRPGRGDGPFVRLEVWLLAAIVAAGGLLELAQGVVTNNRDADPLDWLAEIIAVAAALAVNRSLRAWVASVGDGETSTYSD